MVHGLQEHDELHLIALGKRVQRGVPLRNLRSLDWTAQNKVVVLVPPKPW